MAAFYRAFTSYSVRKSHVGLNFRNFDGLGNVAITSSMSTFRKYLNLEIDRAQRDLSIARLKSEFGPLADVQSFFTQKRAQSFMSALEQDCSLLSRK